MNQLTASIDSPLGRLSVAECDGAVSALHWTGPQVAPETPVLREAVAQLEAYFAGRLRDFDLPLAPAGSAFQQQVFAAMSAIPYGTTRTYGDLAKDLDGFAQAVGQACGANPIPVIIPCHRVLAAGGLGGYSGDGGLETKIALLKLENAFPYLL